MGNISTVGVGCPAWHPWGTGKLMTAANCWPYLWTIMNDADFTQVLADGGECGEVLFQFRVLGSGGVTVTSVTFLVLVPPSRHQYPRLRCGVTSWGVPLCGGLGKGPTDGGLQRQDLGSGVKRWGFLELF